MIRKLKDALEENKIFLELIGIVIISLASLYVAIQANDISARQLEILELQNQPVFDIKYEFEYPFMNETCVNKLVIYNGGGPIKNCQIDEVSFINVEYDSPNGRTSYFRIPLVAYYFARDGTNSPTGKLQTFYQYPLGGPYRGERVIKNYWHYGRENGMSAFCIVDTFIKIHYCDVLNKNQTKYYSINVFDINEISNTEGENIFIEYKNGLKLDIDEVTNKTIYSAINEKTNLM